MRKKDLFLVPFFFFSCVRVKTFEMHLFRNILVLAREHNIFPHHGKDVVDKNKEKHAYNPDRHG